MAGWPASNCIPGRMLCPPSVAVLIGLKKSHHHKPVCLSLSLHLDKGILTSLPLPVVFFLLLLVLIFAALYMSRMHSNSLPQNLPPIPIEAPPSSLPVPPPHPCFWLCLITHLVYPRPPSLWPLNRNYPVELAVGTQLKAMTSLFWIHLQQIAQPWELCPPPFRFPLSMPDSWWWACFKVDPPTRPVHDCNGRVLARKHFLASPYL